jgi:hypothetical protein
MGYSKADMAQMPGAMKKFNEGHWVKDKNDVELGGSRYNPSEMNQCEEYKASVDALSGYLKKHKAKH